MAKFKYDYSKLINYTWWYTRWHLNSENDEYQGDRYRIDGPGWEDLVHDANLGSTLAMYLMGKEYIRTRDRQNGDKFMTKAGRNGHPMAQAYYYAITARYRFFDFQRKKIKKENIMCEELVNDIESRYSEMEEYYKDWPDYRMSEYTRISTYRDPPYKTDDQLLESYLETVNGLNEMDIEDLKHEFQALNQSKEYKSSRCMMACEIHHSKLINRYFKNRELEKQKSS